MFIFLFQMHLFKIHVGFSRSAGAKLNWITLDSLRPQLEDPFMDTYFWKYLESHI